MPGAFQVNLGFGPAPGLVILRLQAGSVTKDVPLAVVAPKGPRLEPSAFRYNFGTVLMGFARDLDSLSITNTGGAPLTISQARVSNSQFRIVSPNVPFTIARGATTRVVVRYTPTSLGESSGSLDLTTNDVLRTEFSFILQGSGVPANGPLTLQIDGGFFDESIGYGDGTQTAFFVNRMAPPKYPAVLRSIQVFFTERGNGLRLNSQLTAIARPNPGGTAAMESFTFLQQQGTVARLNDWNTYTFAQPLRIESGDFVVGFQVNNPPNVFPVEMDRTSTSQRRSYVGDGGPLTLVDIGAGIPGNFLIRAVVTFP